ncbi:MAG: chitobiase/beta-hexosaminidase C-terminal domain-containing protein, partial [Cytophagales bacterium]
RLAYLNGGYNTRLPLPGIMEENGKIIINTQYPGLTIRYTTDGSEPTVKSPIYSSPISGVITVKAKCFDMKGRSGNTSVWKK